MPRRDSETQPLINTPNSQHGATTTSSAAGGAPRASGTRASVRSYKSSSSGGTRKSLVSDTGLALHDTPQATLLSTVGLLVTNVVGAGVLAIPQAMHNASLGLGVIMIVVFMVISMFTSYVLSVACEYTQLFSETQVLARCLVGFAPEDEQAGAMFATSTGPEGLDSSVAAIMSPVAANPTTGEGPKQPSSAKKRDGGAGYGTSAAAANRDEDGSNTSLQRTSAQPPNNNNNNNQGNNDNSAATSPYDDFPEKSNPNPETEDLNDANYELALTAAQTWYARLNLVTDFLLGLTYFLFCVAYARVVTDSCKSVSKSLGFPEILQKDILWLLIGGVFFLAFSMRRVFQEMTLTNIIAIVTIMFVVLCVVIRFFDHPFMNSDQFGQRVNDFSIGGNFLAAFATLSSAYGYQVNHGSFYQELRADIRSPGNMQKTVMGSMLIICATYVTTGLFGYLLFGAAVADKEAGGDIVNNFATDDTLLNVARVGLFFHFIGVYPLMLTAVKQALHRVVLRLRGLDERADDPEEVFKYHFGIMAVEITCCVVVCVVIAGIFTSIGTIISLCGALGGTFALMLAPGIIGWCVYSELEQRLGPNNEKADDPTCDVSPLVRYTRHNNLCGFCEFSFSHRTMKWLSAAVFVMGMITTVGGLIDVLSNMD